MTPVLVALAVWVVAAIVAAVFCAGFCATNTRAGGEW